MSIDYWKWCQVTKIKLQKSAEFYDRFDYFISLNKYGVSRKKFVSKPNYRLKFNQKNYNKKSKVIN